VWFVSDVGGRVQCRDGGSGATHRNRPPREDAARASALRQRPLPMLEQAEGGGTREESEPRVRIVCAAAASFCASGAKQSAAPGPQRHNVAAADVRPAGEDGGHAEFRALFERRRRPRHHLRRVRRPQHPDVLEKGVPARGAGA